MPKSDISRFLEPEVNLAGYRAAAAIAGSDKSGQEEPLSQQAAIDALAVAIAMMIEVDDRLATPRALRLACETVAADIYTLVRFYRDNHAETGVHHLQLFGGTPLSGDPN